MGASIPLVPVKIKRLRADAKIPTYGSAEAAGADVYAVIDATTFIQPGERRMISTGIAVELPIGFEFQVRPRSGLAAKHGLTIVNTPGTVDSDYRGEIKVILLNTSNVPYQVEHGERIGQLVIAPVLRADFAEVDELDASDRGVNGFGSTGKL